MSMLVNVDVAVLPRTRMHGCVDSMSMCTHVSVCVCSHEQRQFVLK